MSFRGEDTRNNFTGHLYDALCRRGINAFIDADKLRTGQVVSPSLLTAIESSTFSIIILSENYASSRWCLVELVKILHCMKTRGQRVLPIFYNVDPSDVRNQRANFAEALIKHSQSHDTEKILVWRDALTEVANLSGWDSRNKHEPSLIKEIVGDVFNRLLATSSSDAGDLVGIGSHFRKMESLLSVGSNDVRIIGIWGMGGIGKTTIARFLYDQIKEQFEAHCFLRNVREESEKHGLVQLQKELLSQLLEEQNICIRTVDHGRTLMKMRLRFKSVLIIVDDAHDLQQLEYLAGKHDWFGEGSRIIITTRDKHLLDRIGADGVYEVEKLNNNDALKLFSQHAFKENHPAKGYVELSNDAVSYAQGLPLALRVLGSFLFGRSKLEWRSQCDKLKENPPLDIQSVLLVSFDGLDDREKDVFLDVACFFKGEDKDYVIEILESCGFYPHIGMRVLIEKALIAVADNKLWMHDLLQEMGRDIVCRTSHKSTREHIKLDPGKRTRLWLQEDVYDVLTQDTGTESIEAVFMDLKGLSKMHFTTKAFAEMKKLRLLKVYYNSDNFKGFGAKSAFRQEKKKKPLSQDFEFPSNKLSYLYWHGYPFKSLPSNFHPKNLVELNLCCSFIKELWNGVQALDKLKFMDLTHSRFLKKISDLSGATNLERLVLEGCTSLTAVNPSLGHLKKLILLSLKDCINLTALPSYLELECLEILILSGCSKLRKLPEVRGHMKNLSKLCLDGTAIVEVPSSIHQYAPGLVEVDLRNCKMLKNLPNEFCNLESLETLLLSDCPKLESLPHDFGKLKVLRKLRADRTALRGLPDSFVDLRFTLKEVSFSGCRRTGFVSWLVSWINSSTPEFSFPDWSAFGLLEYLNLSDCNLADGMKLKCLSCLSSLKTLDLSRNNFVVLPSSFAQLFKLYSLCLNDCRGLQALPVLPTGIALIYARDCKSLEEIPSLPLFVKHIDLTNCFELKDYPSIMLSVLNSAAPIESLQILHSVSAILPGSTVPEWFRHQNEGDTVSMRPNRNPSNFLGFAFCVVLPKVASTFSTHRSTLYLCNINNYYLDLLLNRDFAPLPFDVSLMKSDHICVGIIPSYLPQQRDRIEISFRLLDNNGTKITSCGGRLIYK